MSDEIAPFNADDYKQYDEFIVSEIEEGFIHVQFNNPRSLNAFKESTWRQYEAILTKVDQHPETNVILISSPIAKAFTSGLNLKAALSMFGASEGLSRHQQYNKMHSHISDFQRAIGTPARINTPTIALLNGINYGLALDIAATVSIRIATKDAKFSIREIKIGIPADIGSLQRLPALVNNKSLLFQYALTGAFFNADEALKLGLVSKILPDLASGIEYCKNLGSDINGHQQWAIKGTKSSLQDIIDGTSVNDGLRNIAVYNASNIDEKFGEAIGQVKL
ncbi:ClpP/crotonase-like domain-containing protein [Scheffersomyces coipomensis]|uniref:ClpP/crotonase-like domain-containing protein n=1 Tax=Scheffersomyces coipomensis TaxID=1788519 RepID=UPI00315D0E4B